MVYLSLEKFERGECKLARSENPEVVVRKFFREVQLSGVLSEAKKRRYREKEPNRRKRREIAKRKSVKNEYRRGW